MSHRQNQNEIENIQEEGVKAEILKFEPVTDLFTNICISFLRFIPSAVQPSFSGFLNAAFFFLGFFTSRKRLPKNMFQFSLQGCHSSLSRHLKDCQKQETAERADKEAEGSAKKNRKCWGRWPLCQFHAFTPLNECSKCFILGASNSRALIAMASGISGHSWPLGHPCVHGSFLKIREIKYRLYSAPMGEPHCEQLQDQYCFSPSFLPFSSFKHSLSHITFEEYDSSFTQQRRNGKKERGYLR